MKKIDYIDKFNNFDKSKFKCLDLSNQNDLEKLAFQYLFTFQEFNGLVLIFLDLSQWKENWKAHLKGKKIDCKKQFLLEMKMIYEKLKEEKSYQDFIGKDNVLKSQYHIVHLENKDAKIMGKCPVASEKTLCCNLETIDAFRNCSFGCSYCSIQSYFDENEILIDSEFTKKLNELVLDSEKIYHYGTGQSSDSLLWGNKEGHLSALLSFASKNPNVILEFKTKSSNIDYLTEVDIPRNVIVTWSLNPDLIIKNEEHRTASLKDRLESARKIVQKGNLVGFHFHPVIYYDNYKEDYEDLVSKVISMFSPDECVLISMGTVTFNKKTIAEIRKKQITSKILQMPFVEVAGKFSYPEKIKKELFGTIYNAFSSWHQNTFFYLCMEPYEIWDSVFGYRYMNNLEFEEKMKLAYMKKIKKLI